MSLNPRDLREQAQAAALANKRKAEEAQREHDRQRREVVQTYIDEHFANAVKIMEKKIQEAAAAGKTVAVDDRSSLGYKTEQDKLTVALLGKVAEHFRSLGFSAVVTDRIEHGSGSDPGPDSVRIKLEVSF